MSKIYATLIPLFTVRDAQDAILKDYIAYVRGIYNLTHAKILTVAQELLHERLYNSPEYWSLVNGDLRGLLGLGTASRGVLEGKQAADAVVKKLVDGVKIQFIPASLSQGLLGGIQLTGVWDDFSDILGLSESQYESINKAGTSTLIPWLHWLLERGSDQVVIDYEVTQDNRYRPNSRTGSKVMFPRPKSGNSPGFSIPGEYKGTRNDNWITRAIIGLQDRYGLLLEQEFGMKL